LNANGSEYLFYHKRLTAACSETPMNASIKTLNAIHLPVMGPKKHQFRQTLMALLAAGRMMLRHEVPRDAAGISYFALLALFPAIIVLIAIVDVFLGWMDLHDTVLKRIVDLFPGSHQFLSSNLDEVTTPSTAIVISCIIVVLWSSSWIYTFIESAINRSWNLSHQRTFWESRMYGIALMALGGFSLLFSAGLTTFVGALRAQAEIYIAQSIQAHYLMDRFWYFVLLGTGILIAVLVFAFVFKWTPHRKVLWKEAFPGALVSTAIWEVGSYIFAGMVPFFDYHIIYGRMGAVIAILVWVYTSSLILIFGANFCAQLHWIRMGSPLPNGTISTAQKSRNPASPRR